LLPCCCSLLVLLSANPYDKAIETGALHLNLNGVIVEQKSEANWQELAMGGGNSSVAEIRLRDVLLALNAAKEDSRVKALVLDLDNFWGSGQSSLSAIGEALDEFKESDKKIYAYASFYDDDAYQLAAHANEIWVDPMGGAAFAGPGGSQLYIKELIDRLGVTAHVYRVGTYKSAVEPVLRSSQSPEAKQAIQSVFAALWDDWLNEVKAARPAANIVEYAQDPAKFAVNGKGDYAAIALEQKLVDKIGSRTKFERFVAEQVGVDEEADPDSYKAIDFNAWVYANPPKNNGKKIGIITVAGEIVGGNAGPGVAAGKRIAGQIYRAIEDEEVSALVVRVNSPGGLVMPSENIRQALLAAKKAKIPVVASMGNVAASGGYWVASAADHIVAEPDTITGSIGIFAVLPSFEKALAQWGVKADGVQTTPLSGQPDLAGGLNQDFNVIAQAGVEHGYQQFLDVVANSREMSRDEVDTVGQGRVWDGGKAKELGLVDALGGLDDAIAEAAKRAGLQSGEYHAAYIERPAGFSCFLSGFLTSQGQPQTNKAVVAGRGLFGWAAREQQRAIGQALSTAQKLAGSHDMHVLCLECGAMEGAYHTPQRRPEIPAWFRFFFRIER